MTRPHTSSAPPSAPTVVIVDDDPSLIETLEDLLAAEGYQVEGFTDPAAALARLRFGPPPDLAIVDCIMPELSGAELCTALVEAGIDVPVLMMTALADPSFCVHREDVAVLHKPFVLEDLVVEMEARLHPRPPSDHPSRRLDARV
jgi:two-component system response regulator MprA